MTDSLRGPLPLADAMVEWSDPALLDAVRRAEVEVPADDLRRLGRWRLDELGTLRRPPARYRTPSFGRAAVDALDAAWDRLSGAFRLAVERGEIVLEGVPTLVVEPRARTRLPCERAAELEFDPPAGAVFLGIDTFVGVRATRPGPGVEHASPADGRHDRGGGPALSLREALVSWGDAPLLERIRRLERLVADVNGRPLRFARLFERTREPFDWSTTPAAEAMRPEASLAEAWRELLIGARRRIEAGEWEVRGVQTFPLREAERAPIPGVWAAEFWFDVEANTISVVQFNRTARTYAAVLIRRDAAVGPTVDRGTWPHDGEVPGGTPAAEPGVEDAAIPTARGACSGAAHAAQGTSATGDTDDAAARANGVRRGRESAEPAIEAVVRACWDEVHAHASVGGGTPVWTELARMVERRMQAASRRGDIPQVWRFHTIRKHLPEIYARVLSEKDAAGQSAQ